MTLPRLADAFARRRRSVPEGVVGPARYYVSTANGHADVRKAVGARRYAPPAVVGRYHPAVVAPAAAPRRTVAPLRWANWAAAGLQMTRRVLRATLHLLLDESTTASSSQRVITDASIRHNMPIHMMRGYGSSDLN